MKRNFYDNAALAAVILVPFAPVIFFGVAIYKEALPGMPLSILAIIGAFGTAVGLEFVGLLAGYVGLELFKRGMRLWILAFAVMVAYVVMGASALSGALRIAFLIAPLAYILLGLLHLVRQQEAEAEHSQEREDSQATENREWQREQERIAAARQHELDILEVRQRHEATIERARIKAESQHYASTASTAVPALPQQSGHECEDCGQSFGTVQALNAHGRWCNARAPVQANGRTNGTQEQQ
jgi:hypothetical protein